MVRIWIYLSNPFLILGLSNFKKAVKISTYTDAQLFARIADPLYAAQYAAYHPLHLAMLAAYDAWKAQGGTQKGSTTLLRLLMAQLRFEKINAWDAAVRPVFGITTPNYISIFPQGHGPFQTGQIDARIHAVEALSLALSPFPALVAVKADVDAFATAISNARIAQEGEKGDTGTDSDILTEAVIAAMNGLYAFLGNCIARFFGNPASIEPLFDLQSIRHHLQTDFTAHVKKNFAHFIAKRTFVSTDMIKIENIGTTVLRFYLAVLKGGLPGVVFVEVNPGDVVTVPATSLGSLTSNFLMVFNPDVNLKGEFNIEINP